MSFQFIYLIILFLFINSNIALSQVEIVGDQNFTIVQNDDSINIPFFSNENIHNSNESINRAVIVIHGMNRNADDYYNSIYSIVANNGLLSETIIIAPQFLITLDLNYWEIVQLYFGQVRVRGSVVVNQIQLAATRVIMKLVPLP